MLKSDHFGIEITKLDKQGIVVMMLKSDHFGIEMQKSITRWNFLSGAKIRPFWD